MTTTTTTPTTYRWRWAGLVALLAAEAMNLLDTTVVQVAAPTIHAQLGGPATDVPWYGAAYTLPFALLLINGGRLGDRWGRRRVFAVGVVTFMLASVAGAVAPSVPVLLGARVVQGGAAAAIVPQTFGLIRAMFGGAELAAALGSIGPVMGLAAISGPLLGAVVTAADLGGWSWRAAFLINVPLALAVLALVPLILPDRAEDRPRFDVIGTALAVGGAALVTYPLIAGTGGWSVVTGVVVLVGLGFHQRWASRCGRATLIALGLFRDRAFPAALVVCAAVFAVMNGVMLVIALHAQLDQGRGVLAAGLALLPWTAGSALASLLAGTWLVPRVGARVMPVGLAVLAVGLGGTLVTSSAGFDVALGVGGAGLGLVTVPFFTAALARVRPEETGSAAGLLNAVQQLGATVGVAVLGALVLGAGISVALGIALATTVVTVIPATVMLRAR